MVLGIKFRALHIVGKCYHTELYPQFQYLLNFQCIFSINLKFPKARVAGLYEPPDVGAGNQNQELWSSGRVEHVLNSETSLAPGK